MPPAPPPMGGVGHRPGYTEMCNLSGCDDLQTYSYGPVARSPHFLTLFAVPWRPCCRLRRVANLSTVTAKSFPDIGKLARSVRPFLATRHSDQTRLTLVAPHHHRRAFARITNPTGDP